MSRERRAGDYETDPYVRGKLTHKTNNNAKTLPFDSEHHPQYVQARDEQQLQEQQTREEGI